MSSGDVIGISWQRDRIRLHYNGEVFSRWEQVTSLSIKTAPPLPPWDRLQSEHMWAVIDLFDVECVTIVSRLFPPGKYIYPIFCRALLFISGPTSVLVARHVR